MTTTARYHTFTKLGVRYRFFRTYPNRWGDGRVHLQFWSKTHKQYALVCNPSDVGSFSGYHGYELMDPAELTCKLCIRSDPR